MLRRALLARCATLALLLVALPGAAAAQSDVAQTLLGSFLVTHAPILATAEHVSEGAGDDGLSYTSTYRLRDAGFDGVVVSYTIFALPSVEVAQLSETAIAERFTAEGWTVERNPKPTLTLLTAGRPDAERGLEHAMGLVQVNDRLGMVNAAYAPTQKDGMGLLLLVTLTDLAETLAPGAGAAAVWAP